MNDYDEHSFEWMDCNSIYINCHCIAGENNHIFLHLEISTAFLAGISFLIG